MVSFSYMFCYCGKFSLEIQVFYYAYSNTIFLQFCLVVLSLSHIVMARVVYGFTVNYKLIMIISYS